MTASAPLRIVVDGNAGAGRIFSRDFPRLQRGHAVRPAEPEAMALMIVAADAVAVTDVDACVARLTRDAHSGSVHPRDGDFAVSNLPVHAHLLALQPDAVGGIDGEKGEKCRRQYRSTAELTRRA
jgi:hypothetical protein